MLNKTKKPLSMYLYSSRSWATINHRACSIVVVKFVLVVFFLEVVGVVVLVAVMRVVLSVVMVAECCDGCAVCGMVVLVEVDELVMVVIC